ncbi:multidrug effflux MFS transporter [Lutimaribacter sp. EGI FJ00015]|uniref:Multidrug effflux MFS transporter n=1 Tax=Lutimaribacter degradans TaxID=2945989 RepID=A0ACC5ZSM0_9RHOB|nr:multidrug effflux MFS transporter [Lutimaribacter sp. EGI FJ00013]MCM2561175.1 multidrug effflux MFS transporter [Lutimaribacter sp. EGI FJ00013]MCO0611876.1 multidrug effflux MFS transporter [Lutimaribacter sp. EGI FJ00015]MCO0635003.1 multidrug effflux MFS transporter [Lutimaribacter sp. EGI FJ00014]
MRSKPLSLVEFIALMAMLFATIAFSIDAMLPGLPQMAAELTPAAPNRIQMIVTSFVIGMGLATFFIGPLSDALGRRPVLLAGAGLYVLASLLAWQAQTLELLLAARVLQGIGASGPRVVAMAIVRDLYSGRQMARILSLIMMTFTLVPAIAPLFGAWIISLAGWRAIFLAFVCFSVLIATWLALRQPESLPVEKRRPLRFSLMVAALMEMLRHPTVSLALLAQAFCYTMLFSMISLVQPIYDKVFDAAESFPYWFALVSLIAASASFLNARLVIRLGMRRLASFAFGTQVVLSLVVTLLWLAAVPTDIMFGIFIGWQASVFFQTGLTIGNLNALAMEPMGHVAGMAASVIGSVSTILGALMAVPIGLVFDGTLLPLSLGIATACLGAYLALKAMVRVERRYPST